MHSIFQTVGKYKPSSFYGWFKIECQEWKGFGITCSESEDFQWWYLSGTWRTQMCLILVLKRGSITESEGITLPDGGLIKRLHEK